MPLHGRDLYAHWLGSSQELDMDCIHAVDQSGIKSIDWLIVDHYSLDVSWESLILDGLGNTNRSQTDGY